MYHYAQTHETLELWFQVWKAYNTDVREHRTPAQYFIDITTLFWNKCMGNDDTARKVIHQGIAKYGSNCGPGLLYWLVLLYYILY